MKIMTPKAASKNMILISWVGLYAAIAHVVVTDGRARGSLSLYECILKYNIMRGYIANAIRVAITSANHAWMDYTQKE